MSVGRFLQQGAAGNAGEAVYVDDVFSTDLYIGANTTKTITNGIDLDGEGGLVWLKQRTNAPSYYFHQLMDTARGATYNLQTNTTSAQSSQSVLSSFNSDGYTVGSAISNTGTPIVGWTFRKQPGFFDVQTYTGNGGTQTVNHDLGCKPGLVIVKRTDSTSDWGAYMRDGSSDSEVGIGYLNLTGGFATSGIAFSATSTFVNIFSSSFSLFNATVSGATYVVYLFAMGGIDTDAAIFGDNEDESIIKCGTMTGSTNNFVDLGWEPQFLIVKRTNSQETWHVIDTMRGIAGGSNVNTAYLFAESSASELSSSNAIKVSPTGFYSFNGGGNPYFYVAIRRPHKPASEFAATDLFALQETTTSGAPLYNSSFPVDMGWYRFNTSSDAMNVGTRLLQGTKLETSSTSAESTSSQFAFDYSNGWNSNANAYTNIIGYMFRRAPGFFDVVCYTGNGASNRTIEHNLGVTPQMIIVKGRSITSSWCTYHEDLTNFYTVFIEQNGVPLYNDTIFKTAPTESVFGVGSAGGSNQSGASYISYHFASAPGISKVGSYTGTGSNVDVNCGFTSGARFVLVKRTDAGGDWYVWDSVRGIVAGNDPYLLLNSTAAQVTSTDYIDPLSSGFTITSSAPAALNASGGSYIFLAIA